MIEMCTVCAFVHRDDRLIVNDKPYRAYKAHYHWRPIDGEIWAEGHLWHATICHSCCPANDAFKLGLSEFFTAQKNMPEKYKIPGSLNAPLPDGLIDWASEAYKKAFEHLRDFSKQATNE